MSRTIQIRQPLQHEGPKRESEKVIDIKALRAHYYDDFFSRVLKDPNAVPDDFCKECGRNKCQLMKRFKRILDGEGSKAEKIQRFNSEIKSETPPQNPIPVPVRHACWEWQG